MNKLRRRQFIKYAGMGIGGALVTGLPVVWPDERAMARAEEMTESFVLLREEQRKRKGELPKPADFHRLPLSWHKAKVRSIKEQVRERGVDGGILLTDRWNVIYTSGLHHTTTQRLFFCFFPIDQEDAIIWFFPYLDAPLLENWWNTRSFYFFDFHHAEGGYPNKGEVLQGNTVNLWSWVGQKLRELGQNGKTIGVDANIGLTEVRGVLPGQEYTKRLNLTGEYTPPKKFRPTSGGLGMIADALPKAQFVAISDIMIRNRIIKDEMETRLTQLAEDYFSEIHAFARNYLIERGPGVIDWEIANAAQLWGMHRIMRDIPQRGEPNNTVGISVSVSCRSGRVTAYPHPNQISWSPVRRGDALQIAGVVRIGGYGGELYRSFLIHPWTEWQERVWEVHTQSYFIQAEQSYEGNTCSNVAKAVHDYQVKNKCAHLIYHRPGHGVGMEGHQPPFHALGDYTVMKKGMHFSNEPGLYDPKNGFGFNHSNNIIVSEKKGLQQGTVPVTKEWCFLKL